MAGPVILTLGSWAEQHLQEVLTAKSKSAFTEAFDVAVRELADAGCFSPSIEVDGELADEELTLAAVDLLDG